jgi:hypothetical protein
MSQLHNLHGDMRLLVTRGDQLPRRFGGDLGVIDPDDAG